MSGKGQGQRLKQMEVKPEVGRQVQKGIVVDFCAQIDFRFCFGFPWFSSFGECFWVINVEAHAAHCRMASTITISVETSYFDISECTLSDGRRDNYILRVQFVRTVRVRRDTIEKVPKFPNIHTNARTPQHLSLIHIPSPRDKRQSRMPSSA